jgi:hypothetical protein
VISESFCEINSSEGSLPDFPLGFEQLMEVSLVDFLLELKSPHLDHGGMIGLES